MSIPERSDLIKDSAVRAELNRILNSDDFKGADRMSALITYLVDCALRGQASHVKESVIGIHVFGRDPAYDTKLDPVVRVSASRLRQRLASFYERHGCAHGLRIEIAKGSYVPQFVPVESAAPTEAAVAPGTAPADTQPESPPAAAGHGTPVAGPFPAPVSPPRGSAWRASLTLVALAATAGTGLYLRERNSLPAMADLVREGHPFTNVVGTVLHPSFSPDSSLVVFDWNGPGGDHRSIYIQAVDAATPTRLTESAAADSWPVFSPDGGRVAFLRTDGASSLSVVERRLADGYERVLSAGLIKPTDRPRLDWSPDGKWLLTQDRQDLKTPTRLVLVHPANGTRQALTSPPGTDFGDGEACFSPDSRTIAFRRTERSGVEDVFLLPVSGGEPRRVTFDNRGISGIAWRPDGKALVESSRRAGAMRQLWEFPLPSGPPQRLSPPAIDAGGPAISRDGRALVYVQTFEDKNIYALNLHDESARRPVIQSISPDMGPVVSPNGKRLAFRSLRTGADEIWVANLDGGSESRLTRMDGPETGAPKWSADGSQILFHSRSGPISRIFAIPALGGEARPLSGLTSNASSPFRSPDGQSVYFASDRGGRADVWRQCWDCGAPAQQVTKDGGGSPKLSPDSRTLYFTATRPRPDGKSAPGLYRLSLAPATCLPASGELVTPLASHLLGHWAAATSAIYFVEQDDQAKAYLKRYDFATRRITAVRPLQGRTSGYDGGLSLSPDESTVFYTTLDRLGTSLVLGSIR